MCKEASFINMKNAVYWSEKSDAHEDIIREYSLHLDGLRGPNGGRIEISPPGGDLSLPLSKWVYKYDDPEKPDWWDDAHEEKRGRLALKDWKKCKLTGWKVKEAFHPVNPLLIERTPMSESELRDLVEQWASVRSSVRSSVGASVGDSVGASVSRSVSRSVWASVGASVGSSVRYSVGDSVGDSVGASVGSSVYAYIGGLFQKIREWKYAESLGSDPWRPLLTLWYAGYVPSYDGTTWRVHAGPKAKVLYQFTNV